MRWKLLGPHYLNVPGGKWEYTENDRITGRPKRTQFDVPTFLDPTDASQWTIRHNADEGEIVVCHEGKGEPRDLVFYNRDGTPGHPTPDMIPLDDEAQALSDSWEKRWSYRPQEGAISYNQSMIDDMQQQMADLQAKQTAPAASAIPDALGEVLTSIAQTQKQMTEVLVKIANPVHVVPARPLEVAEPEARRA